MTHTELIAKVGGAIRAKFEPDPRALEALEEALLTADVGPQTAAELVAAVKEEAGRRDAGEADVVRRVLKAEIARRLSVRGPSDPGRDPARHLHGRRERHGQDDDGREARRARRRGAGAPSSSRRRTRSAPPRSSSSRSGRTGSASRS